MSMEFYNITWTGKRLERTPTDALSVPCSSTGAPTSPWEVHSCLGDDSKVWCEVYRNTKENGGIFVLRDFDDVLFVAHAASNMAFVQALSEFAQMVSHPRYASDIFENADEDVFDD